IKDMALKASGAYKNSKPCPRPSNNDPSFEGGSVSSRFGFGNSTPRVWGKEMEARLKALSRGTSTPVSVSGRIDSVVFMEEDECSTYAARDMIPPHLMKMVAVVQIVIAKTVGPLTPTATFIFDAIQKADTDYIVDWNGVVDSRTVIIQHIHKPYVGSPPKKRKKLVDELASQSCSSGKLSRKGKSVKCSKPRNLGHNMKCCKGQSGASQVGGSSQGVRQATGARNISSQAVETRSKKRNASSQVFGYSQPSTAPSKASQGPGARKGTPQVKFLVLVNQVHHQAKQAKDQVNIIQDNGKKLLALLFLLLHVNYKFHDWWHGWLY
nr:hypothetical protein [Tanacetum cinerariifolium]